MITACHPLGSIIPDARVEDFRQAYKKSYGEDISTDEARDMALRLTLLYELVGPLPGEEREDHHLP
jgi:hypothetical protein